MTSVMRNLKSAFINNPSFMRSTRSRMRGMRTFILPVIYALVLGIVLYITLSISLSNLTMANPAIIGRYGFIAITIFQCIILTFVCPTLTAGVVTSEKEKQTYDMLVTTPLHPRTFIFGEIFSSVFFAIMIIISSLPLTGLCLVFGGVSLMEVFLTYTNYIILAVLFTSYGILVSTTQKKTSSAMGASVGLLSFLLYPTIGVAIAALSSGFAFTNATSIFVTLIPYFEIIEILIQRPVIHLSLGWLQIPYWTISFFALILISVFFLTIASRKFYSSRNRALSPRQFIIVYIVINFFLITSVWNFSTLDVFLWSYTIGIGLLLLFGVLNFIPEHPLTEDYLIVPEDLIDHAIEKSSYQFRLTATLGLVSFMVGIGFLILKGEKSNLVLWFSAFIISMSVTFFAVALSQFLHRFVMSRRSILAIVFITLLFLALIFPMLASSIIAIAPEHGQGVYFLQIFSPFYALLSITDPTNPYFNSIHITVNSGNSFPLWVRVSFIYLALAGIFTLCALFKTATSLHTPSLVKKREGGGTP